MPTNDSRTGDYLHAAETVLADAREPLTVGEITRVAIQRGLLTPTGKTPIATMSARLYVEVQRNPLARIARLAEPGPTRARRGTVRWALRP